MKKFLVVGLLVACAGPALAQPNSSPATRSANAGGVNGNGKSSGQWCYDSIPLPAYMRSGLHMAPCWSNT